MYISLQFKLQLEADNKKKLLELMRKQSSAIRSAYNMLKKGLSQTEVYNNLRRRYSDIPSAYISSAIYKAKQYPTDKKVVFGGKALFEKLCKNRDTPNPSKEGNKSKARQKLKREWKEKRQGTLISIGSKYKTEKGNRNLRFEQVNSELYLRIALGDREFIYAKVLRKPSNEKDKWNTFLAVLFESAKSKNYFPYTVELKLREGEVYGNVVFEYPEPEIRLTRKHGVIGIDTNASPLHLIGMSKNRKGYEEWLIAHKIVEIAKEKGKAIAIEDLKKVKKGYRGDGKAQLRKRLHNWNFKSLLSKIERLARLNGIEVIKVNPAYTSVIGSLKYAPQLGIDKDIASAYVIGRRALGFKEEIPENYLKLLSDREYIEYALYCYEEKERELKENLKKETNQYKQNAIKSELRKIQNEKSLLLARLESLQDKPSSCEGANGRNPKQGKSAWQVLRVAILFPVLGRSFVRDLSPLKPILVQGVWDWVRNRLVPLEVGGTVPRRDFLKQPQEEKKWQKPSDCIS